MAEWKVFFGDLKKMTTKGFKRPGPIFYFVSIIVIAGGVGVWLPWISLGELRPESIMTYIFALLAAIIADFLTQDDQRNDYSKDMSVFIISIVVFIICITVIALEVCKNSLSVISLALALALLWWLWWILLEVKKFDIPPEVIAKAIIGTNEKQSDSKDKSLAAFKSDKSPKGDN